MNNVGNYSRAQFLPAEAKQQRREVKQIANDYQRELRNFNKMSENDLREGGGLAQFAAKVAAKKVRLARLSENGLSSVAPKSGFSRSAKSGGVMAAAVAGRATASVAAGAGAVVHGATLATFFGVVGAVETPLGAVTGTFNGMVTGTVLGATMPVSVFKPVTAIAGGVAGVLVGGGSGAVAPMANMVGRMACIPELVAERGSLAHKAFRKIDRYQSAKEHVQQKSLSTQEIARRTERILTEAATKIESKRCSPQTEIQPPWHFQSGYSNGAYRAAVMEIDSDFDPLTDG